MLFDSPGGAPKDSSPRYRALIERLYAIAKSGMTLGLGPMSNVLEKLGHPERVYPAIHVAGSNGKGSTAAFLASILAEHGLEVGLYTSPHLVSLTERIQIVRRNPGGPVAVRQNRPTPPEGISIRQNRPFAPRVSLAPDAWDQISEDEFVAAMEQVERAAPNFDGLSFFEVITAAGLVAFRTRAVDVAVVESGLGARLDATRLVDARVSVLTDLALEHTEILGDTLAKIAQEKIAVARPGRPLVAANAPPEAQAVIDREARAIHAGTFVIGRELEVRQNRDSTFELELGDRTLTRVSLSLLGAHQGRNAVLAAKAASLFAPTITDVSIRAGLSRARWPGRLEIIRDKPPVLLDGAHNPQGAEILASALSARRDLFQGPLHMVFGVLADKDALAMLRSLGPLASSLIFTRPGTPRARDPREILALCSPELRAKACVIEAPAAALREARLRVAADQPGWVVVCGSLYLIGDVRASLPTE